MKVTLIYASRYGQAKKIAEFVAQVLEQSGLQPRMFSVPQALKQPDILADADAAILGSPLYFGAFDKQLAKFVVRNQTRLAQIPTAFFAVSFAIASPKAVDQMEVPRLSSEFLERCHWQPQLREGFAGALCYSRYGWFKKRFVHWIARKAGLSSDMEHDLELTDWDEVRLFAQRFVELLSPAANSPG